VIARGVGSDSPFVIVCDHAGRAVPASLDRLGLPESAFALHIAYDIGALEVAATLGERLGAVVIAQAYSRLVIDCNRAPGHAQSVVEISDGVAIPGNQGLSLEAAEARVQAIHTPYHTRIAQELKVRDARGRSTVLICQHSFTPVMAGQARPWHVGVLHLGTSPISKAMLSLLAREDGLMVGDNEPYAMDGIDYTAPRHGSGPGRDMLELEVRQDLIADPAGQARFAALLARLLPAALAMAPTR
jgi:predicted N-formylglutamate amidohydrolase